MHPADQRVEGRDVQRPSFRLKDGVQRLGLRDFSHQEELVASVLDRPARRPSEWFGTGDPGPMQVPQPPELSLDSVSGDFGSEKGQTAPPAIELRDDSFAVGPGFPPHERPRLPLEERGFGWIQ